MSLRDWRPLGFAPPAAMAGRYARLERLAPEHAEALHAANRADPEMWRFLGYGPFATLAAYRDWVAGASVAEDPVFYAIRGAGDWAGVASWLRLDRANGVIEIGHIALSAGLQRTPAATEAIHLMIDHAIGAGFRRVEWKCNAANAASRRAAARFGFSYEGTFRQHMVVKGENRDTAWFSILDRDWPALRQAHRAWLAPETFDAEGRQTRSLSAATAPLLAR
ncbi:GNAT family N-acetyltransferase [Jannaschia seohaensis]|uniref:Protein N-acetyltransferase, RimJ/RimL family n=1 Tax=Jannaschia seohaensis TaxID=475081 RepID=A0A2Y9B3R6_9RHOB|nr:GNAT family protein [Jannaschia seohaensis]PWJ14408.1 RimJ/RimL family protein N-acetyltransferase [Jannaschia seohaensis]SSA50128.1 Protein N-acetyltransferase, RimJ/RimL family [Jannaschia seohaensis]